MTEAGRAHVAVVTIAHGRHDHLASQHRSLARGSVLPDTYLAVAMDDPGIVEDRERALTREVVHVDRSPGGALPLAAARNLGVRTALERGADVVVLLDVDCLAGDRLVEAYTEVVTARPRWIWSGPVTYLPPAPPDGYPEDPAELAAWDDPHPARPRPEPGQLVHSIDPDLFWSLSFASTPATWDRVGGFCEDYTGYGGEDTDFGWSAVAAGVELWWVGGAWAFHQHHGPGGPPAQHLHDVVRNAGVFHDRHGRWPMQGWLDDFARQGLARRDERTGRWVVA